MQDNHRYEFDGKFVDRAWSNMQQMLDKELPAEQQPERKAWIWWLTGGLLALGLFVAGTYYYSIQPQALPDQQTNTAEAPVADQSANTQIDTDTPAESAIAVQPTNAAGKAALDKEQAPQASAVTTTETTARQPVSVITNTLSATAEGAQPPSSEQEATGQLPIHEEARQAVANPLADTKKKTSRSIIRALPLLSASSVIPLPDLPTPADIENAIRPVRQKRYLKFGVEGSIYSQGVEKLNGIGAAAIIELHQGQRSVYFKSALGYQLFQPDLVEREKSLEFSNTALMPAPAQAGNPPPTDIITTRSSITELRYAYLLLEAGYRLNDRFSVEAGIMPAQLLGSTLTETWTHTPAQSGEEDAGSTPFVSRISDDPVEISNRQFSLIGGLSYQLNASLNLNLHYQYAINDLLPQARNETYLRGAKLSVCYYIR